MTWFRQSKEVLPNIPKDELLIISRGAYSDYSLAGIYLTLKPIEVQELIDQWYTDHPEQNSKYHFEEEDFLNWIISSGHLRKIAYYEWHLEDYSSPGEMMVMLPEDGIPFVGATGGVNRVH